MNKKVLIVEDQFVEANDLRIMLEKAGYEVCGIARSVEIANETIRKEKPELVLLDIFLKGKLTGIDLARQLKNENIAFIYLSANSNEEILSAAKTTEPYGFLVKPFREKDLLVTLEIARYRHEHSMESRYIRETKLMGQLEDLVKTDLSWKERLLETGKIIQPEIPFDWLAIDFVGTPKAKDRMIGFLRIGFSEYQLIGMDELSTISGNSMDALAKILAATGTEQDAAYFNNDVFEKIAAGPSLHQLSKEVFSAQSLLSFPLVMLNGELCQLRFYSRKPEIYNNEHAALLGRFKSGLARAFEQRAEYSGIKTKAAAEGARFSGVAPNNISGFEGIIGKSHLLLNVFDQIKQVAPFDTAVLILGESGTGKERIATGIHHHSSRTGKPLIKVNCATLPTTLIESELFGHEKGSFTGATEKRIGKFEQAAGGTIFLDEIGEMPLDLQVKLLRVLQEKEIEPIGGRAPIKIDVRILAATNRNLEKEVAEGRFRLDLYYRLNVFPIELAPLRERTEDISTLAEHFITVYNRKTGKQVKGVSATVLKLMMAYHWPGNIRELENVIERGVLLAKGPLIEDVLLPSSRQNTGPGNIADPAIKTIHENEREYIISVLKKCNGKIWGADGAAKALNVPPSTLKSKMKKLGIRKEFTD